MESWELIKALSEGKTLFKMHHPDPEFDYEGEEEQLYYDFHPNGKDFSVRSWGWGSALGFPEDRIMQIIREPEGWRIKE